MQVLLFIVCLFDGVQRHFQQYFNYIVAVSFIGWLTGGPDVIYHFSDINCWFI